ncbi:MAG: hypothetical protein MUP70_11605, partial [Candidatus Aminicenantes bacterium]|nr:hypothetical protein [Candidatus Aminicenantes bacterium]
MIRKQYGILRIFLLYILITTVSASILAQVGEEDIIRNFHWRTIGPANMMGRVSALDALDTDYRMVLVGSASGGVFQSD